MTLAPERKLKCTLAAVLLTAGTTALEKPYLRTKALLTIGHLRKYIARKMGVPAEVPVEFYCRGAPLEAAATLDQVRAQP